jgi:hypothetical protein
MSPTEPVHVIAPVSHAPQAEPADYEELKTQFENVATSSIGRWVAAGVGLAVPVITAFCAWLQKEIGINLDPASLTAFIASMAVGIAVLGFKWLGNRGDWERTAVEGYHVYLVGHAATAPTNQIVVVPPGAGAKDGVPPTPH